MADFGDDRHPLEAREQHTGEPVDLCGRDLASGVEAEVDVNLEAGEVRPARRRRRRAWTPPARRSRGPVRRSRSVPAGLRSTQPAAARGETRPGLAEDHVALTLADTSLSLPRILQIHARHETPAALRRRDGTDRPGDPATRLSRPRVAAPSRPGRRPGRGRCTALAGIRRDRSRTRPRCARSGVR
jgi:hypothetical protein